MSRRARFRTRLTAVPLVAALVVGGFIIPTLTAAPAAADAVGMQQRLSAMPTADSLPTAQMNGVVWTTLIVGDTVYVGGQFTSARPAGSALGQNETPRNNIMAFSLSTGALLPFAPNLNAQVKALAVSPDGTRLYVGGNFISSDGVARYRIAAYNVATGALITNWAPTVDYTVNAIVATPTAVYVGGAFSTAAGQPRNRLAAFSTANGAALLSWAPTADAGVQAMIQSPVDSKIIVAGAFTVVNGVTGQPAVVALDSTTGALLPFAVNSVVKNGGTQSAILSLSADATSIYGGGYKFGGTGNLEGMFKASADTGAIEWIEDCHGDTYGVYASANAVYQVGHSHYCGNDGGFPQPFTWDFRRATAFTKNATGTLLHDTLNYTNWARKTSPSLQSWYPKLDVGTYTGKDQAAWAVTGNNTYVVLGGEFLKVNGIAQQGLVRFAVRPISPGAMGGQLSGSNFKPTLSSPAPGTVRVSFTANWDRDDRDLTYKIFRNGSSGTPIYTTTVSSADYDHPAIGFLDTGANAAPLSTSYRLQVTDPGGTITWGDGTNIVADGSGAAANAVSSYGQTVLSQGASLYWPLNESAGTTAVDRAGFNDATLNTGVTVNAPGAVAGDAAMTFSGANTGATGGDLASSGTLAAPSTFTAEAWFKTNSVQGGRIIGFSDLQNGTSAHRDRQVYINNAGKVSFGVFGLTQQSALIVTGAGTYNDNNWHQAVASMGPNGMALYIDGVKVAARTDVTTGETYPGYWRVGGDSLSGFGSAGTSGWLAGSIDEVSVYPTVLTTQQITAQFAAAGRTSPAPADAYGAAIYNDDPTLFWRLGEAQAATTAVDSASGVNTGLYTGGNTKGVAGAIGGTTNTAVTFNGSTGYLSSNATFNNPTVYSVEAWFKTTSAASQKIIGFGSSKTGGSTNYDRHVYLQSGKLVFGANGVANAITSAASYNDGAWHHVVGTQGADGEKLYADGQLIGSNPNVTPQNYVGYWRVGADRVWNNGTNVAFFNGAIDEAAVYSKVLTAAAVQQHFQSAGGQVPNVLPTAAFTSSQSFLTTTVNGSGSADSDGTIASYAWDFGDGGTSTGVTSTHTYATAGTYTVKLTVTDNSGGTAVKTQSVTAATAPNNAPTASFTTSMNHLSVTVNGSASADSDGTVASYAWDFGDGATGTGATPAAHTYATAGPYTITLVVTDNQGSTGTVTHGVTAANNAAPTAVIGASANGAQVTVNGTGSTDDGSITSYAWDFGDGTTATGVTPPAHTYATLASYTITLTVTDNDGLTGTATKSVVLASAVFVNDLFARTVASGWGSADTGGAWAVGGGATAASVSGGAGRMSMAAGATRTHTLPAISQADQDLRVNFALDKKPTGGSTMVSTAVRKTTTGEYRLTTVINTAGAVTLQMNRMNGTVATALRSAVTVAGLNYAAGAEMNLRLQVVTNAGGGVDVSAKIWLAGTTEPATWQMIATDGAATALTGAGGVALMTYLGSGATNAPVVSSFKALRVAAPSA